MHLAILLYSERNTQQQSPKARTDSQHRQQGLCAFVWRVSSRLSHCNDWAPPRRLLHFSRFAGPTSSGFVAYKTKKMLCG